MKKPIPMWRIFEEAQQYLSRGNYGCTFFKRECDYNQHTFLTTCAAIGYVMGVMEVNADRATDVRLFVKEAALCDISNMFGAFSEFEAKLNSPIAPRQQVRYCWLELLKISAKEWKL